jgi:low affinity Fe/Cu permease
MNDAFRKAAHRTSVLVGTPQAFTLAFLVILAWAVTGPLFAFADTWQLVINTGTTIVTFLMVFLIQNTQNRDSRAIHVKLDDLILFTKGPDSTLVNVDELSDAEIDRLEGHFRNLARVLGKGDVNGEPEGENASAPRRRRPPRKPTGSGRS